MSQASEHYEINHHPSTIVKTKIHLDSMTETECFDCLCMCTERLAACIYAARWHAYDLRGSWHASMQLTAWIYAAYGMHLRGSRHVSTRLTTCIYEAHGMHLCGFRHASMRLLACIYAVQDMHLRGPRHASMGSLHGSTQLVTCIYVAHGMHLHGSRHAWMAYTCTRL